MNISRDFVSKEQREFKFKIGSLMASSLAGFLAGAIIVSIIWAMVIYYSNKLF